MIINTEKEQFSIQLEKLIKQLEHVLPAQAPIKDFVHHNTLHGFQHLTFPEALAQAESITSAKGYLSLEKFRKIYAQGRITDSDLDAVVIKEQRLKSHNDWANFPGLKLRNKDLIHKILLYPLKAVTNCQLNWQIEEMDALNSFQQDVSAKMQKQVLKRHGQQAGNAVNALWEATLSVLNLEQWMLHPEEMLDLSAEQAENLFSQHIKNPTESEQSLMHIRIQKASRKLFDQLEREISDSISFSGFLKALTGRDIMDDIRPLLLRYTASYLDQGMSAWHSDRRQQGFYQAWKHNLQQDVSWFFDEIYDWSEILQNLPDDPVEAILTELKLLGIPTDKRMDYLQRLSLELPGWSGMFLWRHMHSGYDNQNYPVNIVDYLAVRLILERIYAQRLCTKCWQLEANLDILKHYFAQHSSEFMVRYSIYNRRLPEYLSSISMFQIKRAINDQDAAQEWTNLANMIWTWEHSPVGTRAPGYSISKDVWPLFRLFQHLGLCASDIASLEQTQIQQLFDLLDNLNEASMSYIWLRAYELNYRDKFFNTLLCNQGRGRWKDRKETPDAQIVFCMDDREEGIRRHLEELNPNIETLGAAAFFGLPINWRGLDDEKITALCPVVVTPTHELQEVAQQGDENQFALHRQRLKQRMRLKYLFHQETRRSLLYSALIMTISAPVTLLNLAGKVLMPRKTGEWIEKWTLQFDLKVATQVSVDCETPIENPTPDNQQQGYTIPEQADKIEGFLRMTGLVNGYAPFIVMMGHGSISENNPHIAAYDCGACSGRHSGPNARSFAAMANKPAVRQLLKARGLSIPENSWFLGAEHNTCDEKISWYDTDSIPQKLVPAFNQLKQQLYQSTKWSAHERCRRLASAPKNPNEDEALKHIIGRSYDFSQARPELGHATNALAYIGRRSATQGAFFDRRLFLISYDPTTDPEGEILERILLAAGPVGAGINLEYYFSTVDNENYGSGSKVTHNVNGLLGVMDGSNGDLRTGLPKQMIEIHEAMRLQIVVEHSLEVLTRIYQAQPILQELIGNGWILLSTKDPDSPSIHVFEPQHGFVPWAGEQQHLNEVQCSSQWYQGQSEALNLTLISQPQGNHIRGQQQSRHLQTDTGVIA